MEAKDVIRRPGVVGKIAADTGINPNTILYWGRRNRIPAEHVIAVERVTGIPRGELRPDLYPPDPAPEVAA